jgi:hypothetical protein
MQALAEVQRRLWRLISAPDGVATALAAEADAGGHGLASWIVDDAQLDAVRRLEVYANAYFQRIHDCLERDFGALAAGIGEAGFHDLVTAYLIAHPSRHASLRFIGAALPDYLADATQAAPFRRRWPWASDLARFEWALGSAFDAADANPLSRQDLALAASDAWDPLVLRFAPAVAVVETEWPVHDAYTTWSAEQALKLGAEPRATCICVWRRGETVHHRVLDALEARLLQAAHAGICFGELCALAAEQRGQAHAPTLAAEFLGRWVDDGLVVAAGAAG